MQKYSLHFLFFFSLIMTKQNSIFLSNSNNKPFYSFSIWNKDYKMEIDSNDSQQKWSRWVYNFLFGYWNKRPKISSWIKVHHHFYLLDPRNPSSSSPTSLQQSSSKNQLTHGWFSQHLISSTIVKYKNLKLILIY